jgi:HAD superfamily hydrolase (TIGR01490 family)
MSNRVAFFDIDETLLNCKSMISFFEFFIKAKNNADYQSVFDKYIKEAEEKSLFGYSRENLNISFYELWKGFNQSEVRSISLAWYLSNKNSTDFFIQKSMDFLKDKKENGYLIAAVSGSTYDILHAFISEYSFDFYFFSEPEVVDGIYTGSLLNYPMIGQYKAKTVKSFLNQQKMDATSCIAMGDHESDIPMLKSVGSAFMVKNREICLMDFTNI